MREGRIKIINLRDYPRRIHGKKREKYPNIKVLRGDYTKNIEDKDDKHQTIKIITALYNKLYTAHQASFASTIVLLVVRQNSSKSIETCIDTSLCFVEALFML